MLTISWPSHGPILWWRRLGAGLIAATDLMETWRTRAVQRRDLARLANDPFLLRDLGLPRDAIHRETAKPFWRG
jgi:uncharacterized protein YjiS (DUF1127 family)